jgi:hypothetical protein
MAAFHMVYAFRVDDDPRIRDMFMLFNHIELGNMADPTQMATFFHHCGYTLPDLDIRTWKTVCRNLAQHMALNEANLHPNYTKNSMKVYYPAGILFFLIRQLNTPSRQLFNEHMTDSSDYYATCTFIEILREQLMYQTEPEFQTIPISQKQFVTQICLFCATHFTRLEELIDVGYALNESAILPSAAIFHLLLEHALTLFSDFTISYLRTVVLRNQAISPTARAIIQHKLVLRRACTFLGRELDKWG